MSDPAAQSIDAPAGDQRPADPAAGLCIATAGLDDVAAVAALQVRSWQQAYREILDPAYLATLSVEVRARGWTEALRSGIPQLLVARSAGQILGFVSFAACRDAGAPADQAEVWALYVDPPAWSSGVGRSLLAAALQRLDAQGFARVSLWVLAKNRRALDFYRSAGFTERPGSAKRFELGGRQVEEVCYVR